MKTPERFERALSKLIKAFFNDELKKGSCNHCAVGNMCNGNSDWSYFGFTDERGIWHHEKYPWNGHLYTSEINQLHCAYKVISDTGYDVIDIRSIERAFEQNTKIHWQEYDIYSKKQVMEDQFRGLMAVVDVLCKIEGLDAQEYKKAFEYNEEFQPVNK